MSSRLHRLDTRPAAQLPHGLSLTDDLVRIAVIAGDLVNTQDPSTGRDFLRDTAALDYTVSDHPWPVPSATETDVAAARALRARLGKVFREASYGELDALLRENQPLLVLEPEPDGAHRLRIQTADPSLAAVLAAQFALALSVFLADPAGGSLDICEGPECASVAVRRGTAPATCSDRCRAALDGSPPPRGRPARSSTAPRGGRTRRR